MDAAGGYQSQATLAEILTHFNPGRMIELNNIGTFGPPVK
jgi:hypothetical protein